MKPNPAHSAHSSFFQTSDFIAYSLVVVTLILEYIYPTSLNMGMLAHIYLGAVTVLASWTILILAKHQFKKYSQPSAPGEPTRGIVSSGIYAHSRNPMYVGVVLLVIGLGFIIDSIWVTVASVLVALLINYFLIIPEEKYLAGIFGEKYTEYTRRARRWV